MGFFMGLWLGKPKGALEAMRQERENKIARLKKEIEEINREIAKKD